MVIELSSSCSDDCSDVTDEDNEAAMINYVVVDNDDCLQDRFGIDRVKAA